jgi:ABC-type nitrate/sulfonate/bicarbonate transport system substrate-binding protein
MRINLSLLRGICQLPAYAAHARGFFRDEGLQSRVLIEATAWLAPHQLASGQSQFAVMPWTRVAASQGGECPLVVCCGSGCEEAALVVRIGLKLSDVRKVAVPREGGMKDLTALGLIRSLGWDGVEWVRQPSGDGAILSLVGWGADAASMVEPYATMMEKLGIGRVVRRTGDLWPGAPGCSLATTWSLRRSDPALVQAAVRAYRRGAEFVLTDPDAAAEIATRYIGIKTAFIRAALEVNRPDVQAIRNRPAMDSVLALMVRQGYLREIPSNFTDTSFLDVAAPEPESTR